MNKLLWDMALEIEISKDISPITLFPIVNGQSKMVQYNH